MNDADPSPPAKQDDPVRDKLADYTRENPDVIQALEDYPLDKRRMMG